MVKLASAREMRMYGTDVGEYLNAGLYMLATILLITGFTSLLSNQPKLGLVLILIALGLIMVVNVHDLIAHLAGIDFWFQLVGFDPQLVLVEFAAPAIQVLGTLLSFLGVLFLLIQADKGYGYYKLEHHGLNLLIARSVLWSIGSVHNSCQIYERADGYVQVLQDMVYIPFLMGSLLFLVGGILNSREQIGFVHHGLALLGWTWVWFGVFGSLLLFIGGLTNVMKVYKMQQIGEIRLEKLRGGAHERLMQEREGRVPLILEGQRRRKDQAEEPEIATGSTPYKDVLLCQA